jgi:hypothetical protein
MTPNRRAQLETLRRKIRQHPALWGTDSKADQCDRILSATGTRLRPLWRAEHLARCDAMFEAAYSVDAAMGRRFI